MRQISRDPFARVTRYRRAVPTEHRTCGWCGGVRQLKSGLRYLYQYGAQRDDHPVPWWDPLMFCSIGCQRTYYDE